MVPWIILGLLIATVLAAAGMLCTPMRVGVMFDTRTRPAFLLKVKIFGGLLPLFSTAGKQAEKSKQRSTVPASRKPRAPKRRNGRAFAARALREMPTLIAKLFTRVKVEQVDATIRFGLPDPADTGIAYGALVLFLHLINVGQGSNVVVRPDFGRQVFDGFGHMGVRFVPALLMAPMLGFAWATMVRPRLSGAFR